jgi:CheY-like chemotaxis protein
MRKTILVADDSATIRKVVELAFSEMDVRVHSAATGREALERIEADPPDLVLADVVMPEPSGYEICRHVKQSARPVPVLLLAGTFEPFDPERARQCGADGHIVKPFESRLLRERVAELLAGPAPAPPRARGAEDRQLEEVLEELERSEPEPGRALEPAGLEAGEPHDAPLASQEPAFRPWSEAELEALAEAVVRRLSDRVLREIAWEVVPDLAETIIRERLRELEAEEDDRS